MFINLVKANLLLGSKPHRILSTVAPQRTAGLIAMPVRFKTDKKQLMTDFRAEFERFRKQSRFNSAYQSSSSSNTSDLSSMEGGRMPTRLQMEDGQ